MAKRLAVIDAERCVGCQTCMFACTRWQGFAGVGRSRIGVRSAGGMKHGFVVVVCRGCEDPPCARVCPTDALKLRKGGGVLLNESLCIGCENCRGACTLGAIFWDPETEKPVICIHCGTCTKYCPYGVISLEESLVEEGSNGG
ncbi:MAG: 4Fe-4S binding protein [Candidatus Zipacnadales bacterium]